MQPDPSCDKTDGRHPDLDPGIGGDRSRSVSQSSTDLIHKVLFHRVGFLKQSIDEIHAQILQRQQLKDALNLGIDEQMCRTQTEIFQLDFWQPSGRGERRIVLEKQIADLEKEKRHHELTHWQDTGTLKQELRQSQKELNSAWLDLWLVKFLRR